MSLQYCKLSRQGNEIAGEVMGRLRVKAAECKYKEKYMHLKQQFINEINDNILITEIIKEIWAIKDTNTISSEQEVLWAKWTVLLICNSNFAWT